MLRPKWQFVPILVVGLFALSACGNPPGLSDEVVALQTTVAKLEALSAKLAKNAERSRLIGLDHSMEEVDGVSKEQLLALVSNRDESFLMSKDIDFGALYDSWSVVCQETLSMGDYKEVVQEIRDSLPDWLGMTLEEAQKAEKDYNVATWNPPWARVETIWRIGDKIVWGPERVLYLIEAGEWRYHDC